MAWIQRFADIDLDDVKEVGGKNASLGEMLRELTPLGIRVPDGFATTADAYRHFLASTGLDSAIRELLSTLDPTDVDDLVACSRSIRERIVAEPLPAELEEEIRRAYDALCSEAGIDELDVAVRSSATAEDLPEASFAGQQESFLNVRGHDALLTAVRAAYASLFTARAMNYRSEHGFDHLDVALSVGVQRMVRSDRASAGVIFTLDPESGHRDFILVTSSWGLGESVVQGRVGPDQYYVHTPRLRDGYPALVWKKLGTKERRLVYSGTSSASPNRDFSTNRGASRGASADRDSDFRREASLEPEAVGDGETVRDEEVPADERLRFSLTDEEVLTLARWSARIDEHYTARNGRPTPMDIEWAKDGLTGALYVVQARPETVHSRRTSPTLHVFHLRGTGPVLASGLSVGEGVAHGKAAVISNPSELGAFHPGDILVTGFTDPDWEPIMKLASGIVTERGGRTSHAAIVARELGIPAVVGTGNAMERIPEGEALTLSCAEGEGGRVYRGTLPFDVEEIDPSTLPRPRTKILLNVGNPERALSLSLLPSDGVGLARMEFVFASWVGVHPLALLRPEELNDSEREDIARLIAGYPDGVTYFVERLAQGIGTLAAAFWPRQVVLRFSDFKTNEYARLVGGRPFEPHEENPMLGWRGASRYVDPGYEEGFLLELKAVRRVREHFGMKNLVLMVPFCRTPEEGRLVLELMAEHGLESGRDGLRILVMAELPSNILLADRFAEHFDGFSIGSNDLTQLTLGVDRDSDRMARLFDERDEAVRRACALLIDTAQRHHRPVGICGQAPSDYPEFAEFLVERGIDSISLNPDALVRTMRHVVEVEQRLEQRADMEEPSYSGNDAPLWP